MTDQLEPRRSGRSPTHRRQARPASWWSSGTARWSATSTLAIDDDPWSQAEVRDRAQRTQAEIGWCLDPAYVGQGYATEAVTGLLGIAFEGWDCVGSTAQCFADNERSWRLMERSGMRREQHTKKDSLHRNGEWLDGMMYALPAEEWRVGAVA